VLERGVVGNPPVALPPHSPLYKRYKDIPPSLAYKIRLHIFKHNKKHKNTMDYIDKYMKLNVLSSKMTGYFSAVALYDTSIPVKVRKEILNYLIDVWKETEPESQSVQSWVEKWEKEIKEISA